VPVALPTFIEMAEPLPYTRLLATTLPLPMQLTPEQQY
jgi:hypothetical protein